MRRVLYHAQREVNSADFNTNYMVVLYLMQENLGPVCATDRERAKSHEVRVRKELGMSASDRFDKVAIKRYAERSQAETSLPVRLIDSLLEELKPLIKSAPGYRSAGGKIDALLSGMPPELLLPLANSQDSAWFRKQRPGG